MDIAASIYAQMSWQRVLTAIFAVLIAKVLWGWWKSCTYFSKIGLSGPMPLPLIGNSLLFMKTKTILDNFEMLNKKYGRVYGINAIGFPIVVFNDVEIAKEVLIKQFHKFHGRLSSSQELPPPYNSMMTKLDGQPWKDLRSTVSPLFTAGKLRMMSPIFETATLTLLGKLAVASGEETEIDLLQYFKGYTMEVIVASAFGLQSKAQTDPDDAIMKSAQKAMRPSKRDMVFAWLPYFLGKRMSKMLLPETMRLRFGLIQQLTEAIIAQRRKQQDDDTTHKDMLQLLLMAQHPEKTGHKLSDAEVLAQSILFLLAGYETSSSCLLSVCYFLAKNSSVQEKLFNELKETVGGSSVTDFESMDFSNESPYLDAVIHESLRLTGPGTFVARRAVEDLELDGIPIKKNTGVMFPAYIIHRDPQYWSEPNEFQPERFLPENKSEMNQNAFMGFGQGPRNCVGMRFALAKVKHVLVRVLTNFRFETCSQTSPTLERDLQSIMSDKSGTFFRVFKRSQSRLKPDIGQTLT